MLPLLEGREGCFTERIQQAPDQVGRSGEQDALAPAAGLEAEHDRQHGRFDLGKMRFAQGPAQYTAGIGGFGFEQFAQEALAGSAANHRLRGQSAG